MSVLTEPAPAPAPAVVALDVTPLLACWLNTNTVSPEIARYDIVRSGHGITVNGTPAVVFALDTTDRVAQAFSATLPLDDGEVALQANIKGGVLVVVGLYTRGERRYFHREFYYRSAS